MLLKISYPQMGMYFSLCTIVGLRQKFCGNIIPRETA
ncbi:Hypothetical protein, conserved [Brucella melitensis ATCC 23457]|uniref:Uncharacterized protein n=1 Tax=Brucella melitensis biotype 2 (strain ATCC 23457) TaxID=546272 RepID=C0RH57_BRUMB|nr:Hypothetical protein, conserved [Brucella melitensis ATCC 23457]